MNCTEARDVLIGYLDSELGAEETAAVEAHLAGCAGCRQELEELRRTLELAGSWNAIVPPATAAETAVVLAALMEEVRALRAEVKELKAEVRDLRAVPAAAIRPKLLLPSIQAEAPRLRML